MKHKLFIVTGSIALLVSALILIIALSSQKTEAPPYSKFLLRLAPKAKKAYLDPAKSGRVYGNRGTRLLVPANAFVLPAGYKKGGLVTVKLVEIMDRADFALAGVPLTYNNNGRPSLFESAGMFKVSAAYKKQQLKLKKGKKIKVLFPNIVPGKKYRAYYRDGNTWKERGTAKEYKPQLVSQRFRTRKRDIRSSSKGDADLRTYNRTRGGGDESSGPRLRRRPGKQYSGVRMYGINNLGWWNFDYPREDLVLIKGTLARIKGLKDTTVQVVCIGLSVRNMNSVHTKEGSFVIMTLRKHRVKLFVIDAQGNIGKSQTIYTAKAKKENNLWKLKVKALQLKKPPAYVLKSNWGFKKYLGIYDKKLNIKYPGMKR